MHEYSIVQDLLDKCEEIAEVHNVKKIIKVVIKIGVLSGIEPHLLKIAFDTFKERTVCSNATLQMEIQKLTIECFECKEKFIVDEIRLLCPKCGGLNSKIVDGEDMYLMSLEME